MNARTRWAVVAVVVLVALGATVAVGYSAWTDQRDKQDAPSEARTAGPEAPAGDRIVFRNTASGEGYGHVATVPLADPGGPRSVLDVVCDRVDASADALSCLRTERGILPSYDARLFDTTGKRELQEWSLPGVPSRTRFSPDGSLVATTAFVTGHSYATIGFSTVTEVHHTADGSSLGNLEDWELVLDGKRSSPTDRNVWGVTFVDDTSFYATVGMTSSGTTYLVKGDIGARTLTSVHDDVECPSLSPDGTRLAFKHVASGSGPTVHWTPAVLDIASGKVEVLDVETRNVDDQIAWLDDDTLLYGMPNDTPGDTDVWALPADGASPAELFLAHAWSPSVVKES